MDSVTTYHLISGSDFPVSNTFQNERRLLDADHYKQVFDRRQWVTSCYFKACIKENGLEYSRLGLAVSKKISKLAVVRNMLKRHVRESFRCDHQAKNSLDIIVLPKHESVKVKPKELRQDLNLLWRRCQKSQ